MDGKEESLWTDGNSLLGLHSYHVCNGEPPDKEVTSLKAKNTSHTNQENSPLLRFNVDVKFWTYSIARVYVNRKTRIKRAKNRMQLWIKIKGLLEPAHSCYGLSLYWFLRLAEYRYSWIQFMWTFKTFGINFILFLDSCVIRKLVHSSWWELKKRCVGWRWDGQRSLGRQFPFCWCVYVCGAGSSCKPMTIYSTQVTFKSTSTLIELVNSVQTSHQPVRAQNENTIWRLEIILRTVVIKKRTRDIPQQWK